MGSGNTKGHSGNAWLAPVKSLLRFSFLLDRAHRPKKPSRNVHGDGRTSIYGLPSLGMVYSAQAAKATAKHGERGQEQPGGGRAGRAARGPRGSSRPAVGRAHVSAEGPTAGWRWGQGRGRRGWNGQGPRRTIEDIKGVRRKQGAPHSRTRMAHRAPGLPAAVGGGGCCRVHAPTLCMQQSNSATAFKCCLQLSAGSGTKNPAMAGDRGLVSRWRRRLAASHAGVTGALEKHGTWGAGGGMGIGVTECEVLERYRRGKPRHKFPGGRSLAESVHLKPERRCGRMIAKAPKQHGPGFEALRLCDNDRAASRSASPESGGRAACRGLALPSARWLCLRQGRVGRADGH